MPTGVARLTTSASSGRWPRCTPPTSTSSPRGRPDSVARSSTPGAAPGTGAATSPSAGSTSSDWTRYRPSSSTPVGPTPALGTSSAASTSLPVEEEHFAGVLAWYSLVHHDPGGIGRPLSEAARVLRPGGGLLVGFFTGERVEPFDHAVTTAYRWPPDTLADEVRAAGFTVVEPSTPGQPGRPARARTGRCSRCADRRDRRRTGPVLEARGAEPPLQRRYIGWRAVRGGRAGPATRPSRSGSRR